MAIGEDSHALVQLFEELELASALRINFHGKVIPVLSLDRICKSKTGPGDRRINCTFCSSNRPSNVIGDHARQARLAGGSPANRNGPVEPDSRKFLKSVSIRVHPWLISPRR